MATAFTSSNIQSAFRDNGMIDEKNHVIPNVKAMLGTYRGCIGNEHYLNDGDKIIKQFYDEAYMNGKIEEKSYDELNIAHDRDSEGNIILRDFTISKENCQRAKVLSSNTQRKERLELKKDMEKKELEKTIALAIDERDRYQKNKECKKRVCATYQLMKSKLSDDNLDESNCRQEFADMHPEFTSEHFGRHTYKYLSKTKPTCSHMKAFIQVRKQVKRHKNGVPIYFSLTNVKRDALIDQCIEIMSQKVNPMMFKDVEIPNDETAVVSD
jgi:hypothetical protein